LQPVVHRRYKNLIRTSTSSHPAMNTKMEFRPNPWLLPLTCILAIAGLLLPRLSSAAEGQSSVTVNVVSGGEPKAKAADCRRMLVGPGVNQPDPFPGYQRFVGWEAPIRLKNGTWLVGFNAGWGHASYPKPEAPTGGRAMLIRSTDEGVTWGKPETIIDTPYDDRHPNFAELPDGTLLCTFFTYMTGEAAKQPDDSHRTTIVRSEDGGRTWEKTPRRPPSPFFYDATDGPIIVLKDGSALLAIYGGKPDDKKTEIALFQSKDRGLNWKLLSVVKTGHEMSEPSIAQLKDGQLVLVTRPEGDICWSGDGGQTWTEPVSFGMRMYEPGLVVLKDGTLACLHGSYGAGGLRVVFSRDGGHTWIAPALNHGFPVDPSAYGYGKAVELPDGSMFVAYIDNIGRTPKDMEREAVWGMRFRVRPDYSGIDLLPAPGLQGRGGER
jgi:sialidase-1